MHALSPLFNILVVFRCYVPDSYVLFSDEFNFFFVIHSIVFNDCSVLLRFEVA